MILYVADSHYGAHPGLHSYGEIASAYPEMRFTEDDWSVFTRHDLAADCDLLILNMIAGTCDIPSPDAQAASAVKAYCRTGKPLLLLHGGSASFWPYRWFRDLCGFRWVRPNDPDGVVASSHPVEPYVVRGAKTSHPLAKRLVEMELPEDEIYTRLEQREPMWVLMTTTLADGTYPQCTESSTQWGNRVVNFLPGHSPAVTRHPLYIRNLKTIIDDLLGK